jgi:hypothetical protein
MTTTLDLNEVALKFTELLPLTTDQWLETVAKIESGEYGEAACPTHDYCDANIYMQEAFGAQGYPVFTPSGTMTQETCDYWNEAWRRAKRYWLTVDWKEGREL